MHIRFRNCTSTFPENYKLWKARYKLNSRLGERHNTTNKYKQTNTLQNSKEKNDNDKPISVTNRRWFKQNWICLQFMLHRIHPSSFTNQMTVYNKSLSFFVISKERRNPEFCYIFMKSWFYLLTRYSITVKQINTTTNNATNHSK